MIDLPFFDGHCVAVFGLGISGLAAARALVASGAEVWAWDDDETRRAAAEQEVPLVDLYAADWSRPASLVLSPGIPHSHPAPHPIAAKAKREGVEIIGDIELLARARPQAHYIGITGTNGKSTTTALIGHVMAGAGRQSETGGNLGRPAMAFEALGADGSYVLEMSSYQLELTRSITFDIAVLLNLSADHLDRHGGLDGYLAAKRRIFRHQGKRHTAVVGVDDSFCRDLCAGLSAAGEQIVVPISAVETARGGVYVADGMLTDDTEGQAAPVLDLRGLERLPGVHNWQNAAAAFAACKAARIAPPRITEGLQSFPGLPHRQELLGSLAGVRYVNDSKATNAEATARALACYRNIYWILGGQAKAGGLAGLESYYPRIAEAFLIGESENDFAAALAGRVKLQRCGDLATAVAAASVAARRSAAPEPVVLLSPACASFDQFANFEARGEAFRAAVRGLPGNGGTSGGEALQ
jgi:UDP-N-acetylmuramoylalanine--D-glutamate ligase